VPKCGTTFPQKELQLHLTTHEDGNQKKRRGPRLAKVTKKAQTSREQKESLKAAFRLKRGANPNGPGVPSKSTVIGSSSIKQEPNEKEAFTTFKKQQEDELKRQFVAKQHEAQRKRGEAVRRGNRHNALHPITIPDSEPEDSNQVQHMDTCESQDNASPYTSQRRSNADDLSHRSPLTPHSPPPLTNTTKLDNSQLKDLQAAHRALIAQLEQEKKSTEEVKIELQAALAKYDALKVEADHAVKMAREQEGLANARNRQLEGEVNQLRDQVTQYAHTIRGHSMVVTERDAAIAANAAFNTRLINVKKKKNLKPAVVKEGVMLDVANPSLLDPDDLVAINPSRIFDPDCLCKGHLRTKMSSFGGAANVVLWVKYNLLVKR
jgi:hypothetical protein